MIFLTVEQVLALHDQSIERYGGSHGIRDLGLLISAVEMAKTTMFGTYLHNGPYEMAAAYMFHLIQNHSFIDGNKRTGAVCAVVFLDLNGIQTTISNVALEELAINVATGKVGKKEIAAELRGR